MEAGLEILNIELEQVERGGAGLSQHHGEAQVLTNDGIQVHPQRHGVELALVVQLVQENLHVTTDHVRRSLWDANINDYLWWLKRI